MRRVINILFCIFIVLFGAKNGAIAQLPSSDIYTFGVEKDPDGKQHLRDISFLSAFNKKGYNNQISPFTNGKWFFTSAFENESFTDIFLLDLKERKLERFTKTDGISEFSPKISSCSNYLYTVRIEKDGKTQTIWQYPLNKSGYGKRLVDVFDNIGYYEWINSNLIALFLVNQPVELVIFDLSKNRYQPIASQIGRCLKYHSDGLLYFVAKLNDTLYVLKTYDPLSGNIQTIIKIDSEDFEFLDKKTIITTKGSHLLKMNLEEDHEWLEWIDLSDFGIKKPNRLSFSAGQLMIVNNH
jgi:hypothetical protein